jgi:flagellar motor switch protein FliM
MSVRPYDFRRPAPPSGGLEQRLTAWLCAACRLAGQRWQQHLPYRVEVALGDVEALAPDEALGRLPEVVVGYRAALGGDEASSLFAWPRPLALTLVAGALGDETGAAAEDRELTPIEAPLCEYLMQEAVAGALTETWPGARPAPVRLCGPDPTPRWTRLFAGLEVLLCCSFTLSGPMGEHEWYWLVPAAGPLGQLGRTAAAAPAADEGTARKLEAAVRELPVEVVVGLGSAELTLAQLAALRPGDLLILDQRVTEPLACALDGQTKFRGWPGRVGGRQAVSITALNG